MTPTPTNCSGCGTAFECGVNSGQCWCMAYPPFLTPSANASCLCSNCLPIAIGKAIQARLAEVSLKEALRLAKDYPLADSSNLIEHIDYSIENGFFVFSRWYHLRRGNCCGNGCLHCPYGQAA